ncbi:hypothetical protein FXO37_17476 [Capsicum annuum]|nr:hypothetical protein FXO37_17476 [Capsicum annuum]
MEGTTSSTPDSYSIYTTLDPFENFHRHLESLRQLMIEACHLKRITTNQDTSILPSINSPCVQVQDNMLPPEDSRRVPQEHMVVDQMELLAKNANFGKKVMQGRTLDKLPCNESFPKEQLGCHDPNLGKGHTSCELKGNNVISYAPINLECRDVASSSQVDVADGFLGGELHESSLCDTPDIFRLNKDQTLVVSESTLVCELPTTSEDVNDDQPTHECSPLLEHMCGVFDKSRVSDEEGVDHGIGDDSLSLLYDESHIDRFTQRNQEKAQSGEGDLELLEYLGNPNCDSSCEHVFVCDPFAAHCGLYLCGDYSLKIESGACLEISSISSLCVSYVEHPSGDELGTSEYLHKGTIVEIGEKECCLDPCLRPLLPFDPGANCEYDDVGTTTLLLGLYDLQSIILENPKAKVSLSSWDNVSKCASLLDTLVLELSKSQLVDAKLMFFLRGRSHICLIDLIPSLCALCAISFGPSDPLVDDTPCVICSKFGGWFPCLNDDDCEFGSLVKGVGHLGLTPCLLFPFDPGILLSCGSSFGSYSIPFDVYAIHFFIPFYAKLFMSNFKDMWVYVKCEQPWVDDMSVLLFLVPCVSIFVFSLPLGYHSCATVLAPAHAGEHSWGRFKSYDIIKCEDGIDTLYEWVERNRHLMSRVKNSLEDTLLLNDVRRLVCNTWKTSFGINFFAMNDGFFLFEMPSRKVVEHMLSGEWTWKKMKLLMEWWKPAMGCWPVESDAIGFGSGC